METEKVNLLRRAMDAYHQRSQAASSNIANLDTPGYQRLSVEFEQELQEAREGTPGAQNVGKVRPEMEVEDGPPVLEDELMTLSDTKMRNQLASRGLREHFKLVRMGITGRSG